MVPPASHRIPRVLWYSGYCFVELPFAYRALTYFGSSSQMIPLSISNRVMQSSTPQILLSAVWPAPLSLATTQGISVDVFSSPYLDVSVQAVPLIYLFDSVYDVWKLLHTDFSIRKSAGQSSLTAHRSLSQLTTSFFGSQCQGIHPALFFALPFAFQKNFSSFFC